MGSAMLTVGELSAGYGRIQVLNGVSFAVAEGEFVGVLGHNGMGKTTLLKTLIGIIRATAGRVTMDGADITAAPSHARARLGIGYVPQGRGTFPARAGAHDLRALGRCLCGEPRRLLLDEPTEGIQPSIIEEIIERLRGLRDRRGLTIVLVEQNLDFIRALSTRVLIIQKGRITREMTAEHLADPDLVGEFVGLGG